MPSRLRVWILPPLWLAACQEPVLPRLAEIPSLSPLTVLGTIEGSVDFNPFGVAGAPDCSIATTGGEWGTVVRISALGRLQAQTLRVPGGRIATRIEQGPGSSAVLWSPDPPLLAILDLQTFALDSVVLPKHPWGHAWVGPATFLSSSRIAFAPVGDPGAARMSPDPWKPAPAVYIVDRRGDIAGIAGAIPQRTGLYLSWLESRLAIGSVADTIIALSLYDGVLTFYVERPGETQWHVHRMLALPKYFVGTQPVEEIRRLPWIQTGGELVHIVEAPQLGGATISPSGLIYAIRNYDLRWKILERQFLGERGSWQPIKRGLEVYSRVGRLMGAFELPSSRIRSIRVDGRGRLFLRDGDHRIIIAEDPFAEPKVCLTPRADIIIDIRDESNVSGPA